MSKADDIFWKQFGAILVALTLFTVVVFFIARDIAGGEFEKMQNAPSAVAERIAPVAKVRVGDPAQTVAAAAPVAAQTQAQAASEPAAGDGEAVYNSACVACHLAGVAGAPKLGDKAAWEGRLSVGEDALVQSVVKGKGAMPPKAGNPSLTEEQIRAAVQHMVNAVSPGAGAAGSTSNVVAAAAASAASTVTQAATAASETAKTAVAATVEKAQSAVSETAAKVATTVASTSGGKSGEEIYNSGCVACHLSGAAGAPKLDDKDAWTTRAGTGLEAMVQSVVKGKGAMPPKGANPSLSEGDIEAAVRYILEQAGVTPGS